MSVAEIKNPGGAFSQAAQGPNVTTEMFASVDMSAGDEAWINTAVGAHEVFAAGDFLAGVCVEDAASGSTVQVCRSGHARFYNNTGSQLTGTIVPGAGQPNGLVTWLGTFEQGDASEAWIIGLA